MTLAIRAVRTAAVGLIVFGIAVFVPAGTIDYWQGWAFIFTFTVFTNIIGIYLALKDPVLLERRIKAGPGAERRPVQKVLITLVMIGFVALIVVSALDWRFGCSHVPAWVSVLGNILVAAGLMINLWVLVVNRYGSSAIEKMEGQRVISTGPYALVRHPMYAGVPVMVVGLPLALGSYWGLLFLLLNVVIRVLRILDEETMLRRELDGYTDYSRKVRHRLVPGLW